jgi:hypothetical protein
MPAILSGYHLDKYLFCGTFALMSRTPETIVIPQPELLSRVPVIIAAEEVVLEQTGNMTFSSSEFTEWMSKRGVDHPEEHPLVVSLRDSRDGDQKCKGKYSWVDGIAHIDLYTSKLFEDIDKNRSEFGQEVCQDYFNDRLNRSLAHELEHYADTIKGEPPINILFSLAMIELAETAEDWIHNCEETQAELNDRMQEIVNKYNSGKFYDVYYNQPHEIRAREAAALYPHEQGHMLWVDLADK